MYFIADQQHVVLRAQLSDLLKVPCWGYDDSGGMWDFKKRDSIRAGRLSIPSFTLNRLDQERGGAPSVDFQGLLEIFDHTISNQPLV